MNWELWLMRSLAMVGAMIFVGEVRTWYMKKTTTGRKMVACLLLVWCLYTTGIYMCVDVTTVNSLTVFDWIALFSYCFIAIYVIHINTVSQHR